MAGRKTKLSKKTIAALSDAIGVGATLEMAAAYAGISRSCLFRWMQEGRAEAERLQVAEDKGEAAEALPEKKKFLELFNAVEEAKAQAGLAWQNVINNAAAVDPQWAWKMLQTRFPKDYAPAQATAAVTVTGPEGQPLLAGLTEAIAKIYGPSETGEGE